MAVAALLAAYVFLRTRRRKKKSAPPVRPAAPTNQTAGVAATWAPPTPARPANVAPTIVTPPNAAWGGSPPARQAAGGWGSPASPAVASPQAPSNSPPRLQRPRGAGRRRRPRPPRPGRLEDHRGARHQRRLRPGVHRLRLGPLPRPFPRRPRGTRRPRPAGMRLPPRRLLRRPRPRPHRHRAPAIGARLRSPPRGAHPPRLRPLHLRLSPRRGTPRPRRPPPRPRGRRGVSRRLRPHGRLPGPKSPPRPRPRPGAPRPRPLLGLRLHPPG